MHFEGTPSDRLPAVLATGGATAKFVFVSLSERAPDRRDAEYLVWHSLDHRPEQYRLAHLRNSIRLVSTPECRAARAVSVGRFDRLDHVMNYQFTGEEGIPAFTDLGAALGEGGRMPVRLPSLGYLTGTLAGKAAAPRVVAGADVIPWRPARGVWLMIETGAASPESLIELPGVAGVWWFSGKDAPLTGEPDPAALQITYCFLDEDPVACAPALGEAMRARWASGATQGLLAAPFYCVVPWAWDRYLP